MSVNLQQNINLEQYFQLIIEQLISLNNKIEILKEKINNIESNNKIKINNNFDNNFNIILDWESIVYY